MRTIIQSSSCVYVTDNDLNVPMASAASVLRWRFRICLIVGCCCSKWVLSFVVSLFCGVVPGVSKRIAEEVRAGPLL